ncbi:uroporphyrinogen decarboxylase/cobalamine-independent methonine synthase family protein [Thalassiella azotivora]
MVQVTGVGSWPGVDVPEAQRTVVGELAPSAADGVRGLAHLVELPSRGPGAELVGRGAALLVDLPVDLQPSGWRFVDAPGRDLRRAHAYLDGDLEVLAEVADGWAGPLKVQVAGPWTLAASLRLHRGERSVCDAGARRDVVDSLAEGVRRHVARVQRLLPGAQVVLQVDEPSLPAVLAGRLPTSSGFGRLPAVDVGEAERGLRAVVDGARAAGAVQVAVHCCAGGVPFPVLRGSGADAVAVDVTLLDAAGWESVAVAVEAGQELWAGVLPTDGRVPAVPEAVAALRDPWRRVGLPLADLATVTVAPACGLAPSTPALARQVLTRAVEVARALADAAA